MKGAACFWEHCSYTQCSKPVFMWNDATAEFQNCYLSYRTKKECKRTHESNPRDNIFATGCDNDSTCVPTVSSWHNLPLEPKHLQQTEASFLL